MSVPSETVNERPHQAYGIDIGGSGIKGAMVDTSTGTLLTDRTRIATPQPSTPKAVAKVVAELSQKAGNPALIGATFPAIIQHGVARSAANVDQSWIDTDVDKICTQATQGEVYVLNDADAAGLAEVRFGAAKGVPGVVIVLTFGTGIGSGLFLDGQLVPNTELGHLEIDGKDAESRAAASVKDKQKMSYKEWAKRVNHYLRAVEKLFTPDLFVLGGGVSKDSDKWLPELKVSTPMRVAQLLNNAGIVGAALAAVERHAE
ncbi:MAG: polyphosphate--glucose phosphotransferase [Jatrophihabitans sp.]